ncbi:hypothetical protein SASPL_156158 [Salvia splendens]|uniref:DUF3475 domain-containing protein n=1 Tax=Salvia splendens TaxID=180675 RepID=A0A8X8YX92_SALSN|nr:hypothetical protein SASPL_156158 [Salvia splendens]
MVAEAWILRMGNQVSSNLKHALYSDSNSTKKKENPLQERQVIGILSFEVANVMSKIMNLHKSLSESEVSRLKNEILRSEGIRTLVSSDEKQLLELALVEKLDDLNRIAGVVSRLGKKCSIPALQGFEHVYGDVVSGVINVGELSFLVKDMEGMMRKMERCVSTTVTLYSEMDVMNELESATKKFRENQLEESRKAFEQKLVWQRQDVKHLKDVSLWNQTFDKAVELLARTVCTVYARIHLVFGDGLAQAGSVGSSQRLQQLDVVSTSLIKHASGRSQSRAFVNEKSGKRAVGASPKSRGQKGEHEFGAEDFNSVCGIRPGRMFLECLSLSSSASKVDADADSYNDQSRDWTAKEAAAGGGASQHSRGLSTRPALRKRDHHHRETPLLPASGGRGGQGRPIPDASDEPEKDSQVETEVLLEEPGHLRRTISPRLEGEAGGMLRWLGPLAHNTIKWQSERNFEQQQQIVTRTNVLLLQTLCYADRGRTEEAICDLLVGLNYICRYEQQQNALLDCASSFDFEDCVEWQLQARASFQA